MMRTICFLLMIAGACALAGCDEKDTSADGGPDAFLPDQKTTDQETTDQKIVDQKTTDQKTTDQKVMDQKVAPPTPGKWVTIKAGTFNMGSPKTEPCREPAPTKETQHQVTLTNGFEIQTTEVTQDQFFKVLGYKPSYAKSCGGTCPVETVTWSEAAAYCNALSKNKGLTACYTCVSSGKDVICTETIAATGKGIYSCKGYRLPTEAEWESAYRAGTTTALYNGAITNCFGADANASKIGWYSGNSANKPHHPVGQKTPNAWGLYDMAGSVNEWCQDSRLQTDLGSTAVTDPVGSGYLNRVYRGGSWGDPPMTLRAAFREDTKPTSRASSRGFRCARTL